MTTPGTGDVDAFVRAIPDEAQRADAQALVGLMGEVSGEPPVLWGPSIVGFGQYHYRYDSGREGDSFPIGFSPRKGRTVLYLAHGLERHAELLARLGKHSTGASCLYLKRLADVDLDVLRELLGRALHAAGRTE